MKNARYLGCCALDLWKEQIKNDIDVLINRSLRCMHYEKCDVSVEKLKTEKKMFKLCIYINEVFLCLI